MLHSNEGLTLSNNFVWISKMIVDETGEVQQSIKDILRNNCFKIPRIKMLQNSVSVDIKVYACN